VKRVARILLTLTLLLWVSHGALAGTRDEIREGEDFVRLTAPLPLAQSDKIEVLEFFSYGGMHSKEFEPYLSAWRATLPADVEFHRVPVLFASRWLGLAKVYYTLEALDMERALSSDVFFAVQNEGLPLFEERSFLDWVGRKALDRAKVAELYNSPPTTDKINQAKSLAQACNVQVVPMLVVDRKFATNYERARTHSHFLTVLDQLIARARAERRLAQPAGRNDSPPAR
jgi:thiol:disulfide interchange protein DsbA